MLEQCSDEEELSSLSHIVDTVLYNINSFVLPTDGQDILGRDYEEDDGNEEIKEESDLSEDEGNEESEESDKDERNERKKVSRQGKENKGIYEERKHPLVSIEESIKKFKKIDRSSWGKYKKKMGFPEIGIHVESLKRWGYNQDGGKEPKYFYLCPFSDCPCKGEFRSPRTADAHINRILGYEYGPCKKCGKGNANLDIFNKHQCKKMTQGTRKRKPNTESNREKDRKRPRVSTEQKRKRDESPLTKRYRRVLSDIERKGKGAKKVPKKQIKGFFSTDSSEEDTVDKRIKRKRVSTAQHLPGDDMDEDFRKKRKTKHRVSSNDGDDIVPKSRKEDKASKGKGSKKFTITDSEDEHGDAHDRRIGTRKDQKRRDAQDGERTGLDLLKNYEDSDEEGENIENRKDEKEQDDKRNKGKQEREETEEERKIRKKREKKLRKEKKRRERERENENNEEIKQTEAEKTEREDENEEGKQTDENQEGKQKKQDRREREGKSELTDENEEGRETKEERRARRKKEKKGKKG